MTVLVTDTGFSTDDWALGYAPLGTANDAPSLDVPSSATLQDITFSAATRMIRIDFPSFADGRGFTLARGLRLRGYTGRLRAYGHVISDQYAMARRSGFDEVEISEDLAARQPEADWISRANWTEHHYQDRMRG